MPETKALVINTTPIASSGFIGYAAAPEPPRPGAVVGMPENLSNRSKVI